MAYHYVPSSLEYQNKKKVSFKKGLGISPDSPVLFCIGGGLGARRLNEIIIGAAPNLYSEFQNLQILHVTGKKLYKQTKELYASNVRGEDMLKVRLFDFYNDVYKLSGAADVVITRAGATNLAEFTIQAKPCIVVPNPVLTGGQQLHNAQVLDKANAAVIVKEGDQDALQTAAQELLGSPELRAQYSESIHTLAVDHAADKIAELLETIGSNHQQTDQRTQNKT